MQQEMAILEDLQWNLVPAAQEVRCMLGQHTSGPNLCRRSAGRPLRACSWQRWS